MHTNNILHNESTIMFTNIKAISKILHHDPIKADMAV